MTQEGFTPTAETLDAMAAAMGALAGCIASVLTPGQRQEIAKGLAATAARAEDSGDVALESLLIDLHQSIGWPPAARRHRPWPPCGNCANG